MESLMAEAIFDITDNDFSQHQAARKWGIPQSTISSRMRGWSASAEQKQPRKHIYRDQKARLVAWILRLESLGYAPSQNQIRACVVATLKNSKDAALNWDAIGFNSFTPKAVNWYFDIRENECGWIRPENTVNVEGGIMSGFGLDSLVVGSSDPALEWFEKVFPPDTACQQTPIPGSSSWMDMEVMPQISGWLHAS